MVTFVVHVFHDQKFYGASHYLRADKRTVHPDWQSAIYNSRGVSSLLSSAVYVYSCHVRQYRDDQNSVRSEVVSSFADEDSAMAAVQPAQGGKA